MIRLYRDPTLASNPGAPGIIAKTMQLIETAYQAAFVDERPVAQRVEALAWPRIEAELTEQGWAPTGQLLSPGECAALANAYESDQFRSRVIMARHGYGRGEYKYFAYPLPALIADLRTSLYRRIAPIANSWERVLRRSADFPA